MSEIKKAYLVLQKKYSLPEYDILEKEFHISDIEKSEHLLFKIRDRLKDKIEELLKFIEDILHPDSGLANMYEYKAISDDDRNKLYQVFKILMRYERQIFIISLENEEKENAAFVCDFFDEWEKTKDGLKNIALQLKRSWETDTNIDEDLSYMG